MTRRTPEQLADEADARLRRAKTLLALDTIKARRERLRRHRAFLSTHRAAEQNRLTNDWVAPATSADSAILADIPRVTARVRQLIRDDGYAKSVVRSFVRNVVGTGLTASIDDRPYQKAWKAWARDKRRVDREKRRNLVGMQRLIVRELIAAGEIFIVRWILPRRGTRAARLVLQAFESEQLDRYKIEHAPSGNEVRGGVEVDIHGAPVAYHFYKDHPNDVRGLARPKPITLESMRVPAAMVSHVYDPERVRQTRGISPLTPVVRKLRDLLMYDTAQLQVARAEASIGLLVRGTALDTDGNPENPLELDGLSVAYLTEDESVDQFVPSRPGSEYDPFVTQQLRGVAAGAGISYEQVARDLRKTTYSGGRQGSIEDHREYEPMQQMLIDDFLNEVFEDWVVVWGLKNTEASGDLFLDDEFDYPDWQGQGWDWVDPEKQGAAVERQMRLGLTTRTIECSRLGRNVALIDEQRGQDGTDEFVASLGKADGREVPAPDAPDSTEVDTSKEAADAIA